MLQRKPGRMGRWLGVSTGWILRMGSPSGRSRRSPASTYRRIDDAGVHITVGTDDSVLPADTIVDLRRPGAGRESSTTASSRPGRRRT